jgi:hypothetical protein
MKDISNQMFGRLTAIEPTGEKRWGVYLWRCKCECGKEAVVAGNSLRSGLVRSCGCLLSETARKKSLKHGLYGSPEYTSWDSMLQRCNNQKSTSYPRYGACGISVCAQWLDFSTFLSDMGPRPKGMSLDRINPFGNYEPSNCRWADNLTQSRNKKKKVTTFAQAQEARNRYSKGESPKKIREELGITEGSINGILYLGQITKPD